MEAGEVVWLRTDEALASAGRRAAAELARRVGLGEDRSGDLALAVTEAATNLQRHSVDGALALRVAARGGQSDVELLALDSGPGIAELSVALRDGSSTAGTLGVGLGAIRRLADAFAIHSVPARGTGLYAGFTGPSVAAPSSVPARVEIAGLTRPISGETQCGDTWAARGEPYGTDTDDEPSAVMVMMCDGLGHGPLAARAGDEARIAFRESRAGDPAGVLAAIHSRLRGTRGAAVAVARVDLATRRVSLCGAGNIAALVMGDSSRQSLLSTPGIVGHNVGRPQVYEAALPPGAALVLHSDGLRSRWQPGDFPGLLAVAPALIAGQLLWQAGTHRDDAAIVVVKVPS
ncbi:Anti-sigma regulatory factor (Ser/Thr protein kinase) [Actinacidiphila rubida]|uniref:Anti-sigma regulatory factor (Ser/Thr protein kinase) n=4 Tax=Actinacidiphila rubida TaxID=310780 RepID=A0A1H8JLS7_9ACTN|nr:Anti-sigma regulatory factor (Ser/Thr protein kinase) [Actinacidiphila rubida]